MGRVSELGVLGIEGVGVHTGKGIFHSPATGKVASLVFPRQLYSAKLS